ncbi:major facilitator superfamily domain-containing protein, partial [Lentinula aff. lateritia]
METCTGRCVGNISPLLTLIYCLGNEHHHPSLCFNDGPAGIRLGGSNVTGFPAAINVAATFNRDLMYSRGGGKVSSDDFLEMAPHTDVEKSSIEYKDEELELYVVDPAAEERLVRRLDRRVVPLAMLIYLLCSLDRSNIGNAKVLNDTTGNDLLQSISLSTQDYTTALMVFLIAYFIFETPSNYMLKAKPFVQVVGLPCAATNFDSLTAVRFLLGMFEAGLFPGLVYFLTFWYKPNERAIRVALILACATLAGAFGGAIAYGVGKMNGTGGLEGWRWLFILEGIPSCLLSLLVLALFPDYPETVRWLNAEERELATRRLQGLASVGHSKISWEEAKKTLKEWRLY